MIKEDIDKLISKALELEKWPIAQLVSLFESELTEDIKSRGYIIDKLSLDKNADKKCFIAGITGSPGSGKSTLIGALCLKLLKAKTNLKIAVIAVDPSSQISGGALLGDRTRVSFPKDEKRLYFRSQASSLEYGGISQKTYQISRVLSYIFDIILVETVGIGQNEMEIQHLSDQTFLVSQPLAGDQIQFMKAGIMEIPDHYIINKCDEQKLANKSYHMLKGSLKTAKIGGNECQIFLTSATSNKGIDELANLMIELKKNQSILDSTENENTKETYYLKRWINTNYGKYGLKLYTNFMQSQNDNNEYKSFNYENKQQFILDKVFSQFK